LIADSSLASCQAEPRRFWPHQPLPGHGRFFFKEVGERARIYKHNIAQQQKVNRCRGTAQTQYVSIAPGENNRIPGNKVSMPLSTLSDKIHTAGTFPKFPAQPQLGQEQQQNKKTNKNKNNNSNSNSNNNNNHHNNNNNHNHNHNHNHNQNHNQTNKQTQQTQQTQQTRKNKKQQKKQPTNKQTN